MKTPSPRGQPHLDAAYVVVMLAAFAVLAVTALTTGFRSTAEAEIAPPPDWQQELPVAVRVYDTACFTCHSVELYAEGDDERFPHEWHDEEAWEDGPGAYDCHDCHAIVDHAIVTRRIDECQDCH